MQSTRNRFESLIAKGLYLATCTMLVLVWGTNANAQKSKLVTVHSAEVPQPIYREYRGVRLGMNMAEARAKLGEPVMKGEDQDFYVFSANETAQIAYDAAGKVRTISTDYTGGVGAPDYRTVVGTGLLERPDGSMYRMVHYDSEGLWVSFNKSAGMVPVVTVTLQVK